MNILSVNVAMWVARRERFVEDIGQKYSLINEPNAQRDLDMAQYETLEEIEHEFFYVEEERNNKKIKTKKEIESTVKFRMSWKSSIRSIGRSVYDFSHCPIRSVESVERI